LTDTAGAPDRAAAARRWAGTAVARSPAVINEILWKLPTGAPGGTCPNATGPEGPTTNACKCGPTLNPLTIIQGEVAISLAR